MKRLAGIMTLLTASLLPLQAEKPIQVGFYEFGLLFNNGKGLDRDVIDALAKRTGRTFESTVMARARIWKDLETGDLAMSVSGIQTPERDLFAWFVPYLSVKNFAIISAKVPANSRSPEAFLANPSLRWGVVASFKHGTIEDLWLSEMRLTGRVEESPDVEVLFKKFAEGRIDGLFSQPQVYKKYLADLNLSDRATIQDWAPAEGGVRHGLIFSKKRFTEAEVEGFRKAVRSLRDDGTLRAIYLHYLSAGEVQQILDF